MLKPARTMAGVALAGLALACTTAPVPTPSVQPSIGVVVSVRSVAPGPVATPTPEDRIPRPKPTRSLPPTLGQLFPTPQPERVSPAPIPTSPPSPTPTPFAGGALPKPSPSPSPSPTPGGLLVTSIAGDTLEPGFSDGNAVVKGNEIPARFADPVAMTLDVGAVLYIADAGAFRVRRFVPGDPVGPVSTFAGSEDGHRDGAGAEARFVRPRGMATNGRRELFVADGATVRQVGVNDAAHPVTTVAGLPGQPGYVDREAALAQFAGAAAVATNGQDAVYVLDAGNDAIRLIDLALPLHPVSTLAGGKGAGFADGAGEGARFAFSRAPVDLPPGGLAVDAQGVIYISDAANQRIRRLNPRDPAHPVATIAGDGQRGGVDGPGAFARFEFPAGLALDGNGGLLVAEAGGHRLRRVDLRDPNHRVTTISGDGVAGFKFGLGVEARFDTPTDVAFDSTNKAIYVVDRKNRRVRQVGPGRP